MKLQYKKFSRREPDAQYREMLKKIMNAGRHTWNKFQKKGRLTLLTTAPMVFELNNGVPCIPDRDISSFWRRPIAELIAFMHGARTLEELKLWGGQWWANWWTRWASVEKCAMFGLGPGDLGPGSYGPGFVRTLPDGTVFNQFEHLVWSVRDRPWVTTHKIGPWIPELAMQHNRLDRRVVGAPCHGDIQVNIIGKDLYLRMDQRSGDVPIGIPANMIQYAALTLMLGQVTGYRPKAFIHSIRDAHMYTDQVEHVRRLVRRKTLRLPTLRITDSSIDDILAFTPEHFELMDYYPHPSMPDIPVTE